MKNLVFALILLVPLSSMGEGYFTKDGLPKRIPTEGQNIENEFYFGVRLWEKNKDNLELQNKLDLALMTSFNEGGILQNHWDDEVLKRHPKLSHDQLTAAFSYTVLRGLGLSFQALWEGIYFEGLWWKYDGNLLHPRDLLFYGYLYHGGEWRLRLLSLIMRFTFAREKRTVKKFHHETTYRKVWLVMEEIKVSEAYMWGLRVKVIDSPWFTELYERLAQRNEYFNSVEGIEDFYFYHDYNHPILKEN